MYTATSAAHRTHLTHSFSISNMGLALPSTEILKWTTKTKTEFETSFFDVSLSDFDLYILNKYLFIPLLVLCIPILWGPTRDTLGPTLQCVPLNLHHQAIMLGSKNMIAIAGGRNGCPVQSCPAFPVLFCPFLSCPVSSHPVPPIPSRPVLSCPISFFSLKL